MTSSPTNETSSSFPVNIGTPAASPIVVSTAKITTTSFGTDAAGNTIATSVFVTTAISTLPPPSTSTGNGSPPPDHSHNSTPTLPVLLGGVLGAVTFVILTLGLFLWKRRIKKRQLPLTTIDDPDDAQSQSDWTVTPFIDPQPKLADRHQEPTPIYTQNPVVNERGVGAQDRKGPILAANPTGTVYAQDSGWRPEGIRAVLVDVEMQPPRYEDAR